MGDTATFRVLVVDDEGDARRALARYLCHVGFVCDLATGGQEALELTHNNDYDLVLTDLRMPGVNGHQLSLELLKKDPRPVVVVLTAVVEPRIANDLLLRGVDELLFKPADLRRLSSRAAELARRRRKLIAAGEWHPPTAASQDSAVNATSIDANRLSVEASEAVDSQATCPVSAGRDSMCLAAEIAVDRVVPCASAICDTHETSASETHQGVGRRLAQLAQQLPTPPQDFDAFAEASGDQIRSRDLLVGVERDPLLFVEILRAANAVLYSSNRTIDDLQKSLANSPRPLAPAVLFTFGAVSSCLVQLLLLVAWIFRASLGG